MLIIGAGTGNDVAIALAKGAQHVDAVEIDPELQRLGVQLNPDHPYQSPGSPRHVTDGRAFLEQDTSKHYDLILFALPDSLTLVAGPVLAAAGELPVHPPGRAGGAKAHLNPRRGLRDVQLLPRAVAASTGSRRRSLDVAYGHAPCAEVSAATLAVLHRGPHRGAGAPLHCASVAAHGARYRRRRPTTAPSST